MSIAMTIVEPVRRARLPEAAAAAFAQRAEPLRRELKLHCYRMLGSTHEAEDLVQETYLRAWRSFDAFEGEGSIRAWLYRIATNACLDALASRKRARRLLPDQHGPAVTHMPAGGPAGDVAWLEPYAGFEIEGIADEAANPEARYSARETVQLAFVAAIQQLAPRQRAALLLCDVVGWAASEAATLLGGSTASINSALQRARETLAKRYPAGRPPVAAAPTPAQQALLGRYLRAWEGHDVDGFVALLKEDAAYTMPPWREWYAGREAIRAFFTAAWRTCGGLRLTQTTANGQPAFAIYAQNAAAGTRVAGTRATGTRATGTSAPGTSARGTWVAHSLHVLSLEGDRIAGATLFVDPEPQPLFRALRLPLVLRGASAH